jgi:hypothetical protein
MTYIVGSLFLIMGLLGVLNPAFFTDESKLTDERIARNRRIWRKSGIFLTLGGIAVIVMAMLGWDR